MTVRKWLVRGLVFSLLGGLVLAAVLYQVWTNPTAMRRLVHDKLAVQFPGAVVNVESARLRLFGGIAIHEVRMARRDDLDKTDFLYVPSGVIYHDKEQMLQGLLAIRKVELYRPRLRIIRERDGSWNLKDLFAPPDPTVAGPTLVIQQGTIFLEDRAASPGVPVVEIKDVNLTAINDPLSTIVVEGIGQTDVAGPVRLNGRLRRDTRDFTSSFELTAVPVGPALVQRLSGYAPELAAHLRQLKASGKIKAALAYHPGSEQPFTYDVTCTLSSGELTHARLPAPLEQIEATFRCANGSVHQARVTAQSGPTRLELTLKELTLPDRAPNAFEDLVREMDLKIDHLAVNRDLFERLPECFQEIQKDYDPSGVVSLTYAFRREGPTTWRKHCAVHSEDVRGAFRSFLYELEHVKGTVEWDTFSDKSNLIKIDLIGQTEGRPVFITGRIEGEKGTSSVELDIRGDNIPLDEKLFQALSPQHRAVALQFHPTGLGDFTITTRRARGQENCSNRFLIKVHDATLLYDLFPYLLENVTGVLDLQPDHWECRDFHGFHKGGEFLVSGRSFPLPAPAVVKVSAPPAQERKDRVQMRIEGRNILLDEEFTEALAPPCAPSRMPLQKAWRTLAIAGRLSFVADVDDLPNRPQDIDVAVDVHGCTMKPKFFPYAMDQVGAKVRYTRDHVYLTDLSARHGKGFLTLKKGEIILLPGGGFQARLAEADGSSLQPTILGTKLLPDAALLDALPPALRKGIEPLQLRDPFDVAVALVMTVPPEPTALPEIWWNGGIRLRDATLKAGVELNGVNGQVWCCGLHNGRQLQGVVGNLLFDQATVLGQPLRQVSGFAEVRPENPDEIRLYGLKGKLFDGDLSGQARLVLGPTLHYEVDLHALGARLDQFGRHNNLSPGAELQGPASASLYLHGDGTELAGLRGNGSLDVSNGKLYRLPLLVDLLKAVSLRLPDRTMFEQAHATFTIEGPQARVQKLELLGNVVSLRGKGTLNLDGTDVNLDFNADPGRVNQMLPSGINAIPKTISNQLLKVKVRGQVGGGKLHYESEPLPLVVDPLNKVFGSGRPDR